LLNKVIWSTCSSQLKLLLLCSFFELRTEGQASDYKYP
jgi:hypothetical protein